MATITAANPKEKLKIPLECNCLRPDPSKPPALGITGLGAPFGQALVDFHKVDRAHQSRRWGLNCLLSPLLPCRISAKVTP